MELIWVNLFLFAGAFVQGIVGMGLGILSAPLVFMVYPQMVPGPMIVNSIILCLIIFKDNRSQGDLKIVSWPILGSIAGSAAAASLLFGIDERLFALVFACFLFVLIILSVIRLNIPINPFTGLFAGFLSALSGTITAIGGPPIALLMQNLNPKAIRANLSLFFIGSSIVAMIALASIGKLGLVELKLSLLTIPGVLIGFYSSRLVVKKVPQQLVRYLVLAMSAASGVFLVIKYL
ncbi:sulfite exporter TauE/SafE family protein [Gayadomonas joobiniege]|uniref:sulfite exporter TauE/SafE family protein n=1 Tax=Gayadomonas joobiniege TaxID=1234606 RepID=UPI0012DEF53C|nr:sulfite exporter TauE/SafE family protein [Gayadomonas joobiniege]